MGRKILLTFVILTIMFSLVYFRTNLISNQTNQNNNSNPIKTFINSKSANNLKINQIQDLTTLQSSYYPEIAFVMPTFTAAAYSGFYSFYTCLSSGTCSEKDGYKYLIRKSINSWGTSNGAGSFITKLESEGYPVEKIHIIKDQDVHFGNLYDNYGRPKYSSIVFFHNEYVSLQEYYNTINFVKAGGNVIILNGNAFFAEVDYNPSNDMVYLLTGHGFQFDGKNGTTNGFYYRFWEGPTNNEQFKYLGSRYSTFNKGSTNGATIITNSSNPHPIALELQSLNIQTIASSYWSHEENSLITSNAHLIAKWNTNYQVPDRGDFIYEFLPNGVFGGSIIHFSFYGSDILDYDYNSRVAFLVTVRYQAGFYNNLPWIRYPEDGGVYNYKNMVIDFTRGYKTNIYLNGTQINESSDLLKNMAEGTYNLSIEFFTSDGIVKREVNFSIDRTDPTFQINISCPCNLTSPLNLQITGNDDHLESIFFYLYNKDLINYIERDNVPYSERSLFLNRTLTIKQTGTYILDVAILDSAGNYFKKSFFIGINGTSKDTWFYNYNPVFQQINSTMGYVKIRQMSNGLTPYFEYSTDYGQTWNIKNMVYNSSDASYISYLTKSSTNFWYRIAVNNGANVFYYRMMRNHYWDNNIYYLNSTSLTINNSGATSKTFIINSLFKQNLNLTIFRLKNQSYSEITKINYLNNTFRFTITNIDTSSSNVFIVLISTSVTNFSIPIYIYPNDSSLPSNKVNYYDLRVQFKENQKFKIHNNDSDAYVTRISSLNYIYSLSRLDFEVILSTPTIGIYYFNITYFSPSGKNLLTEVYKIIVLIDFNVTYNGNLSTITYFIGDQIQYNWTVISIRDINYKFYLNDIKIIDKNYNGSKLDNESFVFNLKYSNIASSTGNYELSVLISGGSTIFMQKINYKVITQQNSNNSDLNGSSNLSNSKLIGKNRNLISNLINNPFLGILIVLPILIVIPIVYYRLKK